MSMNLLSCMKSFSEVINYKGFSNAARHMHISAPVLTKQIQWLERYLNKKLFYRTTRTVQLTEAGELYYQQVKIILNQIQEASYAIHHLETEPHGNIKIAIPAGLNSLFFVNKLKNFLLKYPKITCHMIGQEPPSAINDGLADLVISPINVIDKTLVKECLIAGETGIFASPAYLTNHGIPKTIEDLKNHNCLISTRIAPNNEWTFEGNKKIQIKGNYYSDIGIDIYYAGLNGIGIFLTLKGLVQEDLAAKKIIEISLDLKPAKLQVYLYYHSAPRDSIVRLLADYLLEAMHDCRLSE